MEDNKLNPTGVPEEVNNAAEAVADAAQEGADTIADKVAEKVESFGDAAENVSDKVVDTVTGVVDAAGEAADDFGDKVADVVSGEAADANASLGDKVADVVNAAGDAADTFGEKVADTVSEAFGNATDSAEKAISPDAIYGGAPAAGGSKVLSIVSLVCGIVAILATLLSCCCTGAPNLIFGIAALVTGILAKKKNCEGQGMALAGIIMGGVAVAAGLVWVIWMIISLATGTASSLTKSFNS
ncbi:MAG: hypothetical protein J6Y71_10655 [Ruminococcus sp.]|uniref:DUF4190 domain-containing protein n=1 Tax=Ruminococcus sp. TaxID=41978 RepID=UPI001B013DB8|nr:hypothetical protein [Ruminococcus sp.]MBO7472438.1 hypothetical protein [Ruminococcus sp.]MBP5363457.1 hypothetical protein [Ruminococcus sp.]